jgi:hypothetical protein
MHAGPIDPVAPRTREDMPFETFVSGLPFEIREALKAFRTGAQLVPEDAENLRTAATMARESAMSPCLREDIAVSFELKAAVVDLILVEDPWESDAK